MLCRIIAASLIFVANPSVQDVWSKAKSAGFSGLALVVSGQHTLLLETNGSSVSRKSTFPLCSVTKAFTAELVLELVSQQKLALDGTLAQYLPWAPAFAKPITISQLLTHTSGLANMNGVLGEDENGIGKIYFSYDQSLRPLKARVMKLLGERAANLPGAKYDYNNTDFLVLQAIVEEVLKQPYEMVLKSSIFSKAKMKQTHLAKWDTSDNSYINCFQSKDGKASILSRLNMAIYGGAAGLLSNADDLCNWMKFTLNNPIGQRMFNYGSQFGGFQGFGGYAYKSGAIDKLLGSNNQEPVFERPGAVNGYGLQVTFLPKRNLAVALFSNQEGTSLGSVFEGKGLDVDLLVAAAQVKTGN